MTSACPFCGAQGSETELDCMQCQNIIPFCIASGEACQAFSAGLLVCWPLHYMDQPIMLPGGASSVCMICQFMWRPRSTQLRCNKQAAAPSSCLQGCACSLTTGQSAQPAGFPAEVQPLSASLQHSSAAPCAASQLHWKACSECRTQWPACRRSQPAETCHD